MNRRLLSPVGGLCAFLAVAALVVGGLGWVTVAALRVEAAERLSAARADAANKERLALWQLDGRVLPLVAVENSRPFAHYFALHMPYPPPVTPAGDWVSDGNRVPSPLLTADLPEWMLLHVQLDPDAGWSSPQVVPPALLGKLRAGLRNANPDRQQLLALLQAKFPAADAAATFADADPDDGGESPFAVPFMMANALQMKEPVPELQSSGRGRSRPPGAEVQKAAEEMKKNVPSPSPGGGGGFGGGAGPPVVTGSPRGGSVEPPPGEASAFGARGAAPAGRGGGGRDGAKQQAEPNTNDPNGYAKRADVAQKAMLDARGTNDLSRGAKPSAPLAAGALPPGGPPADFKAKVVPPAPAAEPQKLEQRAEETTGKDETDKKVVGRNGGENDVRKLDEAAKPNGRPPVQPPVVHLGLLRPYWLTAEDGTEILALVRPARMETKTVYQGVVLDWPRLQRVLREEIAPHFPEASLEPVRDPAAATERTMTALPVAVDPGPVPEPPPVGWTPLRLGLAIAWAAAGVALVAVGVGGRSLIDLSERRIRFVSAVTHELRTPLTSLRLYLDLLTSGMVRDEQTQREYLTTLSAESERLNRLVENVLDFARLENRSARPTKQPTAAAELLEQVRATWADRLAADGQELVVVSTLPPGLTLTTDPRMAAQVLGNLIDNARKYGRPAADPRVWLWAKPAGRRIILEVEDRGPGVPAADRPGLFRAFRRGAAADTTAGGAGLGLALATQWAAALGGRLDYRPADGGTGACFRLDLPAG